MEHTESSFTGVGAIPIVYDVWSPEAPTGVLILSHGLGEHARRYDHVVARLTDLGLVVYSPDHRGHGRSGGKRVRAQEMREFTDDLDSLIDLATHAHPGLPVFMLGHSMGGAIALAYALDHQDRLAALVLSGPAVIVTSGTPKPVVEIGKLIGRFLPGVPVQKLDSKAVSRDPAVVAAYDADPLVHHGLVPAGLARVLVLNEQSLERRLPNLTLPLLVMHGTADALADPAGAQLIADRAGSKDLTLKLYDGLYHEVFNEPEKDRVLDDLTAWLKARLDN
ncbi:MULTISPECIES: alpha/beta hydrolase [unclassified Rhodococcus (in: high G+C Gram-positive bacteria)]|uniref:alpha/beta hydrolase n=1 Tax=unclassified Rhodococcus (in: high G+C Gram-positive bacteria) TaxID=192944 RepID=UPI00233ED316|nr:MULTISPECIES: alpha/beta hydrolase [unclassified Rhodococcus (in: high G+C Gram-positive bacteria)]MDC3724267.1 lysophospholipase [Rhodococcus sp. Rp3]WSE22447.1 lysophospholipase [Rhodococcus sp. PD04]